jgi:hypothetical protein
VAGAKSKKDGDKIKRELEAMRQAMALNKIVMKGDIEGVFLTNPARESETVSDEVADNIIKGIERSDRKAESESLDIIDRLTSEKGERTRSRQKAEPRSSRTRARPKKARGKLLRVKIKKARR